MIRRLKDKTKTLTGIISEASDCYICSVIRNGVVVDSAEAYDDQDAIDLVCGMFALQLEQRGIHIPDVNGTEIIQRVEEQYHDNQLLQENDTRSLQSKASNGAH